MNGKELLKKLDEMLDENDVSLSQLAEGDFETEFSDELIAAFGNYEHVYPKRVSSGGSEFDGMQAVYHFRDHNVYISVEGSYSSWEGTDWDDGLYLVEPVQVTEYKRVKSRSYK